TIHKSKGKIPEEFLRGCGLSDADIEYAKLSNPDFSNEDVNKILYKVYELRANQAVQISPLFISYSHADGVFVDKLERHLNKNGIRFWRDVHDMKSGRIETQIDRAIRQNPTVLLILSEHSLKSDWVEHEVRTARELEKEMERDALCPVALDDSWKNSLWPKRVMEQVMEYNILDFSAWKDDSKFGNTFNKLIDGLGLFYKG
ncbi:MAG: toll/interleukin-1 receptor domain-containing protein, partial [Anaerolineae bacterium]|nr:toll/interleukin-1 receptor domain-containing protein [Anaerolineae bacterium]